MALKQILSRLGGKMGIDPNEPNGRASLVAYVQEAVEELIEESDMPGSLIEQTFKVNGDQTITFPWSVGSIRGLRESASQMVWHINQLRPRYYQFNWSDMWRNYRIKSRQCLQGSVKNESVCVITVPEVETPPIVVTLVGSTDVASSIIEYVTMDATVKKSINIFTDYTSIKKDKVNSFDVICNDVDGNLLTTIPNNVLDSVYETIDVSSCPWLPQNTSVVDNYMEVLYKIHCPVLVNDADEFIIGYNYDRIIVNKGLQLWNEEQEKEQAAAGYDAKATRSLARATENINRATEDVISLVAHPHDTLLRRIGTGLRRRYRMFGGRRF